MLERVSDLFFRGGATPPAMFFVLLALSAAGAALVGWGRLRERQWPETAVSVAVIAAAIIETALVLYAGLARLDRIVALGLAASSAMLVFDDWRSGGVAADVWRGARERLRI
ncbi:MAG TPA: hypothetical protein P5256_06410 [Beijerinckiaceae bacterium]|nr:hypothetical protein [Rhodoblastus sp.]MCC2106143.1 hypothetical protein [Hyphomicrobiales bacterium]MCO5089180.1 hypothetical protein [Methylobacteriaceae bacterium]HRY02736.1 hypothetical protein [Beijerinckiaceae bacterium]